MSAVLLLCSGLYAATSHIPIEAVTISGSDAQFHLETRKGDPYQPEVIQRDVRTLHRTGRFSDIRVEADEGEAGKLITFHVVEVPRLMLGAVRTEPEEFRFQVGVPAGTTLDAAKAHSIASEFRRQLSQQGYTDTSVEPEIVPSDPGRADLVLHVRTGDRVRIADVKLIGDPALKTKEILGSTHALRGKRVLPGIPGLWKGWKLGADYSDMAVGSDLARIRSLYLSRGYFDAAVRVDHTEITNGKATVNLLLNAGQPYRVRSWSVSGNGIDPRLETVKGAFRPNELCKCLFDLRREAEKQGIVDFSVRLALNPVPGTPEVDLVATVERGRQYRIRRINILGNRRFSDSTVRANLLLDETDWLDTTLLRKSIHRLNRSSMFEPMDETSLDIATDAESGFADVRIRLKERKAGSWLLSGPMGPISLAGSLQFTLASRLPSWGTGLLDLSSWYGSFSLLAFGNPLLSNVSSLAAGASRKTVLPVFALHRPFLPSQSWMSGVTIAPQLGSQGMLASYGSTQLVERVLPWLSATNRTTTELPVTVETRDGEATMMCESPRPRLYPLRRGAAIALQFASAVPMF